MKVYIYGFRDVRYTNKDNKLIEGYEAYGFVTEPDHEDQNLHGYGKFEAFLKKGNQPSLVEQKEYKVVWTIGKEFNGKREAYVHHLEEVI